MTERLPQAMLEVRQLMKGATATPQLLGEEACA
jgi:hypothetical protein